MSDEPDKFLTEHWTAEEWWDDYLATNGFHTTWTKEQLEHAKRMFFMGFNCAKISIGRCVKKMHDEVQIYFKEQEELGEISFGPFVPPLDEESK